MKKQTKWILWVVAGIVAMAWATPVQAGNGRGARTGTGICTGTGVCTGLGTGTGQRLQKRDGTGTGTGGQRLRDGSCLTR